MPENTNKKDALCMFGMRGRLGKEGVDMMGGGRLLQKRKRKGPTVRVLSSNAQKSRKKRGRDKGDERATGNAYLPL